MKWESYSHPISDIRDWDNNNRLELKPDFQRNEVWSRAAQIMLIDTIIKGIPIPKIYIKSVMHNGNTYRVVIDGQQRLTAILKFVKNKLRLSKPYSGEYEGSLFSDLPDELQNEILRYKIDINEIFNPSEEEIRDLYSRVNIHRDIKPENILIKGETWVLSDFGLCSFLSPEDHQDITKLNEKVGPMFWMSPEAIDCYYFGGKEIGKYSDVFQICLVFVFVLTHKYPGGFFSAEDIDTTPLIKELILEAISNDYHKRPQDGLELVEKFNNATYYQ